MFTKEFHDMQVTFTSQGTFWIFSGICLIGVFYHALLLPETKGKSLEEISAYFAGHSGGELVSQSREWLESHPEEEFDDDDDPIG